MYDLLIEYYIAKAAIVKRLKTLIAMKPINKVEIEINKEMLSDINYIIDWLHQGHEPTEYKAIHKTQCYLVQSQTIEKMIDSSMYIKRDDKDYMDYITDNKHITYKLFKGLTPRELDSFVMTRCEGISFSKVAKLLGVSKGSIQSFIKRAEKKIHKNIEGLKEAGYIFSDGHLKGVNKTE